GRDRAAARAARERARRRGQRHGRRPARRGLIGRAPPEHAEVRARSALRRGGSTLAKFTLRNVFETDKDTFWNKLFFDEEYNRRLYLDALGFKGFELLELTGEPGGVRTRRIRTEPKSEAPAVVTKLIGGDISYTEEG